MEPKKHKLVEEVVPHGASWGVFDTQEAFGQAVLPLNPPQERFPRRFPYLGELCDGPLGPPVYSPISLGGRGPMLFRKH